MQAVKRNSVNSRAPTPFFTAKSQTGGMLYIFRKMFYNDFGRPSGDSRAARRTSNTLFEVFCMIRIPSALRAAPVRDSYADAGDFLRVVCVGFIGWFHIWQQSWQNPNLVLGGHTLRLYPLVACGYMFVDLMLLLSGFLLMLGWLSGRSRDLRAFYTGRAARILPSYLLCLCIMLFAVALPGGQYGSAKHLWTDLLAHLTFTHDLFAESYIYTRLNIALWTLAVEVQFYLIFPFLARAFERSPARAYFAMVALGHLVRVAIALLLEDSSIYFNRLSAMMDVYANGMLAAYIYHRLAQKPQRDMGAWLSTLAALACVVPIYLIMDYQLGARGGESIRMGQMVWRYPLSLAGGAFLVCGSRAIRGLRALFSNRVTRFLSGVSFNFYIWHQFLAVRLKAWRIPPYAGDTPNQDGLQPWQNLYTLTCFAVAFLVALLITYAVEKPCARLIKRRLSARKPLETDKPA